MKEKITATLITGLNLEISLIAPGVQTEAKGKRKKTLMCNTDVLSCFIQQMEHQAYITTIVITAKNKRLLSVSFHLQLLKNLMQEGKVR